MPMTPEEAEYYPTPAWCVHRLLDAVSLPSGDWLDPCVGEGAIPDAVTDPGVRWLTVDIRDTGCADYVVDYTRANRWGRFDVCLMNPPFSKAWEFARKAIEHCDTVIMLQRLNWLQPGSSEPSRARAQWLREHTPGVYVLPDRPSFTGDGKTDSQAYAWYAWGDGDPVVRILDSTPDSERKQRRERHRRQQELPL